MSLGAAPPTTQRCPVRFSKQHSARIGADHLGHAKVSMTQDRYMSRGRVHHQVAELLEHTVSDDPSGS
jgi:hypothetical protein